MKINFSDYNLEGFVQREVKFCGQDAILIFPECIKTKFTQRNKIFRSSIWSKGGELLSGGFPRFVNWGENPDNFPIPTKIKDCEFVLKLDGSCLIADHVDGQFNVRSRGTTNAALLDNGPDWMAISEKYPKVPEFLLANQGVTLLFEITTPNNKIVINYGDKVEYTLIGAVDKYDYSLWTQKQLDIYARQLEVPRPKYYSFSNFEEMFQFCEENKEIEGFCVYWPGGVCKQKTDWYKSAHRFLSELGSFEKVVDFYFANGTVGYNATIEILSNMVDFETVQQVMPDISRICDYMKEVDKIVGFMQNWVDENKHRPRKDVALDIQQKWGPKTNRTGMLFSMLDDREINVESRKKLLYQVIKSNKIG